MDNFTCFNPTKIDFGTGKEQLIGQHLAEHGVKRVLHGAASTTGMTQIAIVETLDSKSADWMEKVSDEQYAEQGDSSE